MMRSSCADVPDDIKSRRLPRVSERSTFAVVFPPAEPGLCCLPSGSAADYGGVRSAKFIPGHDILLCKITHQETLHDTEHVLVFT